MLVGFHVLATGFLADGAERESNFLLLLVHLDDLEVQLLTGLELDWMTLIVHRLGVVAQPFDAFRQFDEGTKSRDTQHLAVDNVADTMGLEEGFPNIGLKLLHAKR